MNSKWSYFALVLILLGCTQAETGVSHRDILDDYKALNIRLETLALPLLAGNVEICDQTKQENGIRWHELADYPEDLQPVAQSYWGVSNEPSVFYVLPESASDTAGVISGDQPLPEVLNSLPLQTVCKYAILVSYVDEINAYATGNEVIVTSGMLRSISDDYYLTLVLAHEISHNLLGHIGAETNSKIETAADEAAIKLMANAGLDFETAIQRREEHQIKSSKGGEISKFESARIADFKKFAKATRAKRDKGEAVWP